MFFCKRYGLSLASTYFLKTWWPFLNPWISNLSIRIHPSTKSASLMCNPSRCMACRFVDSSFFSVWRCVASWKSGMSGMSRSASWMPSFSWSAWVTPTCQGSSSVNIWQTSYQSEIWKHSMWKWPTIYDATSISLAWEQRILLRLNRGCFTWPRHFGNSHGEHTQLSHDLHPRVLLLAPTECWLVADSFTKCPRPCLKHFANTYGTLKLYLFECSDKPFTPPKHQSMTTVPRHIQPMHPCAELLRLHSVANVAKSTQIH